MAQQKIIARGKVKKNTEWHFPYLHDEERRREFGLSNWAYKYVGQTLIISLEEEDLEPIISERLKRVLVEA